MSVLAVCSAKGSPGASITAMALASVWHRQVVVVDADPAGGDLLWRCRSLQGEPLDPDRGLLSLSAAARREADLTSLAEHVQPTATGADVLVGIASPGQLTGLGAVWSHLPALAKQHAGDVVVDCGRISDGSPVLPAVLGADAVLFVVRPDMDQVAHLRARLERMQHSLRPGEAGSAPLLVAVVTSYRDTQSAGHLQQLLDADRIPARVLGVVAHDPKAAHILSSTRAGSFHRTLLARSARVLGQQVAEQFGSQFVGSV